MKETARRLINILEMQSESAPYLFISILDVQALIDVLKDYLDKTNPGCADECTELINFIKEQSMFIPNIFLPEEHINRIIEYLKTYIDMEDEPEKVSYIPKSENRPLYGKCVLQIRFLNDEEYQKWKEFNQRYKWEFDHTYPAIMRSEYEFHTTYEVEQMAKEIVSLLEMGFDVRATDWKLAEFKSQLK